MDRISEEEYNFYAIFPLIQYALAREEKAHFPVGYMINHKLSSKNSDGTLDHHHLVLVNDRKREVIYSIKGTHWGDFGDLFTDLLVAGSMKLAETFNTHSPILRNNIYRITENIIKEYKLNKPNKYKIIFSSHSLGATLQQILIMKDYEEEKASEQFKRMRFSNSKYLETFTDLKEGKEEDEKEIKIYKYVDKVYSYAPGVGLFDSIVSYFDTTYIKGEQRETIRKINNIFYVPYGTGSVLRYADPTPLITDRTGLERIFIGNIQSVEPKDKFLGHTLFNYIDQSLIKGDDKKGFWSYIDFIQKNILPFGGKHKIDVYKVHQLTLNLKEASQEVCNALYYDTVKEFELSGTSPRVGLGHLSQQDINNEILNLNKMLELKRILLGYYDKKHEDYYNSEIKLSIEDVNDFINYKRLMRDAIQNLQKPEEFDNEEWQELHNFLMEIRNPSRAYSKSDIEYLLENGDKNLKVLQNYIIDSSHMPRKPKVTKEVKEVPMNQQPSFGQASKNPQSGIPVTSSLRGKQQSLSASKSSSSKASSKGASTLYRELVGSAGTSTAGSIIFPGSEFEDIAPPDVFKRYQASRLDPYAPGFVRGQRSQFAPEYEIKEKTITEQLYDVQGKPIVDLSGKPITTTKKVTEKEVKSGRKRSKIPVVKDAKPPKPPKIINPKPKATKPKATDKKPAKLDKPKKAVPTVPKPKKEVSAKVSVKKLGAKVDKEYKL